MSGRSSSSSSNGCSCSGVSSDSTYGSSGDKNGGSSSGISSGDRNKIKVHSFLQEYAYGYEINSGSMQ